MEQEIKSTEKETYISPDIEVVDIEIEQFLEGAGSVTNFQGQDWDDLE